MQLYDQVCLAVGVPESRGVQPHHASPPQQIEEFPDFCVEMGFS